jgi:hypothetical protein
MKYPYSWLLACLLTIGLWADPKNTQQAGKASGADRALAAQQANVNETEFNRAALVHRHLHLDKGKRPLFACEGLAAQVGPDTTNYTSTALYPLADTFSLHSRPGAAKVIYLDFNGHTTANTPWNSGVNANVNIVSPAFDLDGDPTTFSDAERAAIQDVWRRVSEDYAAWDVDVTTADPGLENTPPHLDHRRQLWRTRRHRWFEHAVAGLGRRRRRLCGYLQFVRIGLADRQRHPGVRLPAAVGQ